MERTTREMQAARGRKPALRKVDGKGAPMQPVAELKMMVDAACNTSSTLAAQLYEIDQFMSAHDLQASRGVRVKWLKQNFEEVCQRMQSMFPEYDLLVDKA